jgi:hypothetical protein
VNNPAVSLMLSVFCGQEVSVPLLTITTAKSPVLTLIPVTVAQFVEPFTHPVAPELSANLKV